MSYKRLIHGSMSLVFIVFLSCTGGQVRDGIDGIACVGYVENPPAALKSTQDEELLNESLGATDQGRLCQGDVFLVTEPVKVYRVWDSSKPYSIYGSWWSLDKPVGSREQYRKDNDICPLWSSLDKMSSCNLKVGSKIVIGTGQSAKCKDFTYPKSATNQVYVPNDSRNDILYVENCSPGSTWP